MKHYITFNYTHHMQYWSNLHVFFFMESCSWYGPSRPEHFSGLERTNLHRRFQKSPLVPFANINMFQYLVLHPRMVIAPSLCNFQCTPSRNHGLFTFHCTLYMFNCFQPVLQMHSQPDLHHISISSQHSPAFMLCLMGLPYMLRNAVHSVIVLSTLSFSFFIP